MSYIDARAQWPRISLREHCSQQKKKECSECIPSCSLCHSFPPLFVPMELYTPAFWTVSYPRVSQGRHQVGRAGVACVPEQQARRPLFFVKNAHTTIVEDSTVVHGSRPTDDHVVKLELGSRDGLKTENKEHCDRHVAAIRIHRRFILKVQQVQEYVGRSCPVWFFSFVALLCF